MRKKRNHGTRKVPVSFYNYLNMYLSTYSETERSIIRTIFILIYKDILLEASPSDEYLENIFPNYTLIEMFDLCNKFVSVSLKSDSGLFQTVYNLREQFEKASSK